MVNLQNFYTLFGCTSQMDCEGKVYTVIGMTCFVTTFPTWAWAGPLGIALLNEILYKADHNQTH